MTRIKICGITNAEDARAACELGADALGFIYVRSSPRYIGHEPEHLQRILAGASPLLWCVGVFDVPDIDFSGLPEIHAVQYYREPADGWLPRFGGPVRIAPIPIKAYRVKDRASLAEIAESRSPQSMMLLDAYSPLALGGTGHTFNWELTQEARRLRDLPLILAGGLTPENVGEAVRAVRPYMVDVSSGVEAEPGRKDWDKMRRFIRAVREADLEIASSEQ